MAKIIGKAAAKADRRARRELAIRRAVSLGGGAVALLIAVAALAGETTVFRAKRLAHHARSIADDSQSRVASRELSLRALELDPNNFEALFLYANKARQTGDDVGFRRVRERLLEVHPSQAGVRRMAGEEAYSRGDFEAAADWLSESLWINPSPPISQATYWRMAMVASELADQPEQARWAAMRALTLEARDPYLRLPDRRDLLFDVAQVLRRQRWPMAADHLTSVGLELAPR